MEQCRKEADQAKDQAREQAKRDRAGARKVINAEKKWEKEEKKAEAEKRKFEEYQGVVQQKGKKPRGCPPQKPTLDLGVATSSSMQ